MDSLIKAGAADEALQNDFLTLVDWAGAKNGKLTVSQEEKIAKAFEAYLMEGRAPSVRLVDAFRNFKDWLVGLYRSVVGLGVQINDDVRGVFDRMLAGEDEIREAQDFYALRDDAVLELLANDQKKAKLKAEKEKVLAEQIEKNQRERTVQSVSLGEDEAAVRKNIKASVEGSQMYLALKAGEMDEAAARVALGDKAVEALAKEWPDAFKENGKSLERVSVDWGFKSPQEFIDQLKTATSIEDEINREIKRYYAEKEAEQREQAGEGGATPVDRHLHSDDSLEYLVMEIQALVDQLAAQEGIAADRIIAKAFREAARINLENKTFPEAVRYFFFANAERYASRRAIEAARKGDLQKAIAWRKKQLVNHALVLEAVKLRDERRTFENRFKDKKIKSDLEGVENEFIAPVVELLNRYGFIPRKNETPYDFQNLKTLGMDGDAPGGGTLWMLLPWFVRENKLAGDWRKTLTVAQAREFKQFYESLIAQGRNVMASLDETEKVRIDDYTGKIIGNMAQLKNVATPQKSSWYAKAVYGVRKVASGITQLNFLTNAMDGFNRGRIGEARRLFQSVAEAEARYLDRMKAISRDISPHLQVLAGFTKRIEKEFGKRFSGDKIQVALNSEYQKFGEIEWTAEKLIAVMLNAGSEDSFGKLMRGHGWNGKHFGRIMGLFTSEEKAAIQGIWNTLETLREPLNNVHKELWNRNIGKVEAWAGATGLKGGYYPLRYDSMIDDKIAAGEEEDAMRRAAVHRANMPQDRMTKGRVSGVQRPVRLDLNVLFQHLDDVCKYVEYSRAVKDWQSVSRRPEFKQMFTDKFGPEMYETLRKWIMNAARPDPTISANRDFADRLADGIKTLLTYKFLGFNPVNAVAQVSGVVNGFDRLGAKYMLHGFKQVGFPGTVETFLGRGEAYERVLELSDVIRSRESAGQIEMRDELNKIRTDGKGNDFARYAFAMQGAFDRFHVVPFWLGAFQKYMDTADRSLTDEQKIKAAARYADALLLDTQPSSLQATKSELQRARTGLYRHFMMFSSYFSMIGGNLMNYGRGVREGKIEWTEAVRYVLLSAWLASVLEQALKDLLKAKAPNWMDTLLLNPLQTMVGWIPFVRDASRTITVDKRGNLDFQAKRASPPALDAAIRLGDKGERWISDRQIGPAVWETASLISSYYGVPAQNVAKWLFQLHDNATDKDTFKGYR